MGSHFSARSVSSKERTEKTLWFNRLSCLVSQFNLYLSYSVAIVASIAGLMIISNFAVTEAGVSTVLTSFNRIQPRSGSASMPLR
jgi:hypothetical protein